MIGKLNLARVFDSKEANTNCLKGWSPQDLLIILMATDSLPKKLLLLINSLKDNAETSFPQYEVRLANSITSLSEATTDLDILIETPKPLQRAKYSSDTFLSKMTISSPRIT
jgi:hypothetical protein